MRPQGLIPRFDVLLTTLQMLQVIKRPAKPHTRPPFSSALPSESERSFRRLCVLTCVLTLSGRVERLLFAVFGQREPKFFAKMRFDCVVVDEGHSLKNVESTAFQRVLS